MPADISQNLGKTVVGLGVGAHAEQWHEHVSAVAMIEDIPLNCFVAKTYEITTTGASTVTSSGATVTAATAGSFKKVFPGATITNTTTSVSATVLSVDAAGTVITLTASLGTAWSAAAWSYKNLDSIVRWASDNSRGELFGFSTSPSTPFVKSTDIKKVVKIMRCGHIDRNKVVTFDYATAGTLPLDVFDSVGGKNGIYHRAEVNPYGGN